MKLCLAIIALLALASAQEKCATEKKAGSCLTLSHSVDGMMSFKIMQMTDIHVGENAWDDWGPEQDEATFKAFESYFASEGDADLIVLSGDQLTADNVELNATTYYRMIADHIDPHGIPFGMVFGNHDTAGYVKPGVFGGDGSRALAKTSREELFHALEGYPNSVSQVGPADVFGVSNYYLNVCMPGSDEPVGTVLMLDSGGGTKLTEIIDTTQLDWIDETAPTDIPIFAFQHIPSKRGLFGFDETRCTGYQNEGVADLRQGDAGIVEHLAAMGNVHFLGVGHNHGNSYCCAHEGVMHTCYGRHSGYGEC